MISKNNTADVIVDTLNTLGVDRIYGMPGDAINELVDSIRRRDDVEFIQIRHEEAGAFAASAQAKLTGKLAVCAGTAGPGAIHLLNGLYDASIDHAPVLAITGQVETRFLGTGHHQEVNLTKLFDDVCVYNQMIVNEDQIPGILIQAAQAAINLKGVAHISLPQDIARRTVTGAEKQQIVFNESHSRTLPLESALVEAADVLNSAGRIAIMAGIGALEAKDELLDLAEMLQAPIVRTLRAKELLEDEHRHSVGHLGLLGGKPALDAVEKCDAFLLVGTDFPYLEFLPREKPAVQIDANAPRIGRRQPLTTALVGDTGETIRALLPHITRKSDTRFLESSSSAMQGWLEDQAKKEARPDSPLHPQTLAAEISRQASDDAVFTCDTGAVTIWAAQNLRMRPGQRFTLSANLASMGFGLPGAIGAQFAYPDRQVIALCGDGGFTMLMGDFLTAVKYQLPVKVFIFNNSKLGLIKMEQESEGHPDHRTDLAPMDFKAFAEACGGKGFHVTHSDALADAVAQAMAHEGPCIVDVEVHDSELVIPPKIEFEDALKYGIGKIKTYLNS